MTIRQISDVIFTYQDMGRPKATAKTYDVQAIGQMVRLGYNTRARDIYFQSLRLKKTPEYYFISGLLSIMTFDLQDTDYGYKSAIITVDVFRFPENTNFTNFYPFGDCTSSVIEGMQITQVAPGEEAFYRNDPEMPDFRFCVLKASRMDFYNLPTCITKMGIESTFANKDDKEIDIPMDIAYDVAFQILGWELKIKQFSHVKDTDNPYSIEATELRRRLTQAAEKEI